MHFENTFVIHLKKYVFSHDCINRAMSSILAKLKNASEAQSIVCIPHNFRSVVSKVFANMYAQK